MLEKMCELSVSYKRNFDNNYLIIKGDEDSGTKALNNYRYRMLIENRIDHFLNFDMKMNDGVYDHYYEISGEQPVKRLYEHKLMKGEDLVKIITEIIAAFNTGYEYMLEPTHFILEPEYMYMNVETKDMKLMYFPEIERNLEESFLEFCEYVLDRVDHQDSQAAMMAYQMYKIVKAGSFTITELGELASKTMDMIINGVNAENLTSSAINDSYDFEKQIACERNEYSKNQYDENEFTKNLYEEFIDKKSQEEIKPKIVKGRGIFANIFGDKKKVDKKKSDITKYDISLQENKSDVINSVFKEAPVENTINTKKLEPELYGKTMILVPENSSEHILIQKIKGKEVRHDLSKLPFSIGKIADSVDLVLKDPSVSRLHAEIFSENDILYIKDCNSTNGTYVNGMQLDAEEKISLESGDEISIGKVQMEFR